MNFLDDLRRFWPWVVAPMVLVLLLMGIALALTEGKEPFIYVIF